MIIIHDDVTYKNNVARVSDRVIARTLEQSKTWGLWNCKILTLTDRENYHRRPDTQDQTKWPFLVSTQGFEFLKL